MTRRREVDPVVTVAERVRFWAQPCICGHARGRHATPGGTYDVDCNDCTCTAWDPL